MLDNIHFAVYFKAQFNSIFISKSKKTAQKFEKFHQNISPGNCLNYSSGLNCREDKRCGQVNYSYFTNWG